jgi:saccharopine dehydrogenase-like NADP-dependent oxidoreductase
MSEHITVLGAGLVGSAIVRDLASDFHVRAVDLDEQRLAGLAALENVETFRADATDEQALNRATAGADLVVCAVPGHMGFETMRTVIDAGHDVVDISFFPEDAFDLDDLARERGVTAVVDCGVAPGLCNMQAGYAESLLDRVDSYICYVGGLPERRVRPFEYRAVFSPADVLEEYTRPARYVRDGEVITVDALTEVERIDLPGVDTLEAFNTDGLRSLIRTMDIPNMREKTMRYPGHADLMRIFRDSGFLSPEPVDVSGRPVRPLDLTSVLLFDAWKMRPDDRDLTIMRVDVTGRRNDRPVTIRFDLLDRFDDETGVHSMARTTGYTCTAAVRLVLGGTYAKPGITPPEFIGRREGCYESVESLLSERGIHVKTETIDRS